MIRNQWYAVLDSKEVKKGRLLGVTRLSERMVFWRDQNNKIVCLADRCVHRGAAISAGCLKGEHAMCPFHGFEYDSTGRVKLIPANGRSTPVPENMHVHSFPTAERHGMIYIWWGDDCAELPPVPGFADIDEKFPYVTTVHHWPVHYSRAVENQLDLVHVPFVHADTIGRGFHTLVNGPLQRVSDDGHQIEFWVYNEVDKGQLPKKANQLPPPDSNIQHIHFVFPNIWQNWILPKFRVFVAFVPIDEENTRIYLRTLQRFVTVPILREVVDFANMKFGTKVLNQDRRVVLTQIPKKTALQMDEKLIAGDLPIVTYRRLRDEMQKASTDPI